MNFSSAFVYIVFFSWNLFGSLLGWREYIMKRYKNVQAENVKQIEKKFKIN